VLNTDILIKSCETAVLHACMFSKKRRHANGQKTPKKKDVGTDTIKRPPGSGCLLQTKMHFSCRSYLVIPLPEVRHMLYIRYFDAVSLWLSLLAKCKTFNILYINRGKYLSSTANHNVAKQM